MSRFIKFLMSLFSALVDNKIVEIVEIKKNSDKLIEEDKEAPVEVPEAIVPEVGYSSGTSEQGRYHGRHNGDRATWYFAKKMKDYPGTFTVSVPGCYGDFLITNNGTRWEGNSIIMKQSDVSGRGMALIVPASCKSTKATIKY